MANLTKSYETVFVLSNKLTEGYYVLVNFTAPHEFPAELDRIYKITEGVIRSLIIAKEN